MSPTSLPLSWVHQTIQVAYMPMNTSNVIEGDMGSDSSNGVSTFATVKTPPISSMQPKAMVEDIAPLTVPHLYWRCSVNGGNAKFPTTFNALIDHSSHTVLISDAFVASLGLKRQKLHAPIAVELMIPEGGIKHIVMLTEWVKLSMYDPSGYWTLKTIHAVVTPTLCAPVILGLLFLTHNSIVIDHQDRTMIDKKSGLDLLNPTPPPAPQAFQEKT